MSTYKTLARASSEILFKERKSKFYGYAFPVLEEVQIKKQLESLQKIHSNANHVCYAWQLGVQSTNYRANDDGEPNNSAGKPILGQIQSFQLTNVLVAVVRYFGGTKLGVGGLIQAYKETAKLTLENSAIIEKELMAILELRFGYENMNIVMGALKRFDCKINAQQMEIDCKMRIEMPAKLKSDFLNTLKKNHKISVSTT
ncbi:IMPACT family protein [Croceivirga thetidis]|uniref:YigZ family protein n=1 Tax=Croceivirga thetidis TaxID=2721623 RepID=A0ABX1GRK0_9FLAO|nr:YigZ family protein [Croceivirga thetidis]NKI32572.1 YigZ family protein [Croceivirga thetidis]